nr:DUF922 domain-containing protein [Pseudomonas luteola]
MTKSLLAGFLAIYSLLFTDLALSVEDAGRVLIPGETLVDQVRVRPNIVLTVKQTYATYPVLGQTWQEILSSLQQTPLHVHGSKAYGETQWSWDGDYQLNNADGSCSLAGYNLTLDLTMTIPELRTAGLSEGELAFWRDYANGIASHEQVHAKDAMNAAVGWLEQIATLGAFTNCQGLTDAFNGIQAQSLEALRQRAAYVDAHSLGFPSELLQQTTLDTVISSRPE